jgi:hypothetical protein
VGVAEAGLDWEEEMVEGCRRLLANVILQDHNLDQWQLDPDFPLRILM